MKQNKIKVGDDEVTEMGMWECNLANRDIYTQVHLRKKWTRYVQLTVPQQLEKTNSFYNVK